MKNWNEIISKNIISYRKQAGLTQLDLAERLNFSDKSVSKWERGDAIPDVTVLIDMCDIFGITMNDIIKDSAKLAKPKRSKVLSHLLITLISCAAVWLAATLTFVCLYIFAPEFGARWLCFIYAIPVTCIVAIVFSSIWGKWWMQFIFISLMIWSTLTTICLSFTADVWSLVIIGVPLQILVVLWYFLVYVTKRKRNL